MVVQGVFTPPSPNPLPPAGVRGAQCGQPILFFRFGLGFTGAALASRDCFYCLQLGLNLVLVAIGCHFFYCARPKLVATLAAHHYQTL